MRSFTPVLSQGLTTTPAASSDRLNEYEENSSTLDDLSSPLEDLEELTAAQQKILKRAAQWEERMSQAQRLMPADIPLLFFKEPSEVREVLIDIVQSRKT